jgi:hypothetical protein
MAGSQKIARAPETHISDVDRHVVVIRTARADTCPKVQPQKLARFALGRKDRGGADRNTHSKTVG